MAGRRRKHGLSGAAGDPRGGHEVSGYPQGTDAPAAGTIIVKRPRRSRARGHPGDPEFERRVPRCAAVYMEVAVLKLRVIVFAASALLACLASGVVDHLDSCGVCTVVGAVDEGRS